jgi:pimeloyl-ACP methyl ester carboxylesterase
MAVFSIFKTPEGRDIFMASYDSVLSRWPAAYEIIFASTRFGPTHVIASGPRGAPPLVLLSGAGTSSTIWYPNIAGLSTRFRIYAVDTPGDAGKSISEKALRTRSDCAQWLKDVLDGLGIEKAHVAGVSYGGWLAMNIALLAPERVARAVLVAPAGSFIPLGPMFYKVYYSIVLLPYRPIVKTVLRRLSAQGGAEFDRWAEQMSVVVRHCRLQRVFPTVFTDDELRRCNTPVLFIAGEKENLYKLESAVARARSLLSNFKAEVVPGAGHVVNLDQPEKVNGCILKFLSQ